DLEHARLVLETPSHPPQAPRIEQRQAIREDGLESLMIFYDAIEAEHAAQLLRAHGIPCELRNKPSGLVTILAPSILNIVLVVQEEDAERAFDILGFTRNAVEPDEEILPGETERPAPHAIRSESPPPYPEPGHIKRQTHSVQAASEETPAEPATSSTLTEAPQ